MAAVRVYTERNWCLYKSKSHISSWVIANLPLSLWSSYTHWMYVTSHFYCCWPTPPLPSCHSIMLCCTPMHVPMCSSTLLCPPMCCCCTHHTQLFPVPTSCHWSTACNLTASTAHNSCCGWVVHLQWCCNMHLCLFTVHQFLHAYLTSANLQENL